MAQEKTTRNKRIKAALKSGKSMGEVAKQFNITKSRVWEIDNQKRINKGSKPAKAKKRSSKK